MRRRLRDLGIARQLVLRGVGPRGWDESVRRGYPVAPDGSPLPWFTYPSISFLEDRVRSDHTVFEFGAGQSTLWWAGRVETVISCEHDETWYHRLATEVPSNVTLVHRTLESGYVGEASLHVGVVDVLVIDGRRRNDCVRRSLGCLSPRGVVIWDNSERPKYLAGQQYLHEEGFRVVPFMGLGPVNAVEWQTSIYYRDGNCFEL